MLRRKKNGLVLAVMFLLASLLSTYSLPHNLRAQQPQPSTPPLRRIRRVKGEQPKPQPTPTDSKQSTSPDDVLRVDTDLASILLTAVDKDKRFITTLRKEDVRVLENNVPQEVQTFERETDLPLTLAILIDTSRSEELPLPDEKIAARVFIDSVIRPDKDRAAIISFTGEAVLQQNLTNDLEKLRAAAARVIVELPEDDPTCSQVFTVNQDPRCWTGIWDAVWVTVNEVLAQTPEHTRRAIILLTDGDDTSSVTKKQEAIDFAVKNNVVIYSIGIGDPSEFKIDAKALRNFSEKTGGRAFFPANKAELDAAFAQIQQELRSQYLITYQPSNRNRDGTYRQVKIEIVNPDLRKEKLRLLYRQGYYARKA
jgi:Ca-activated chloride channel family protein